MIQSLSINYFCQYFCNKIKTRQFEFVKNLSQALVCLHTSKAMTNWRLLTTQPPTSASFHVLSVASHRFSRVRLPTFTPMVILSMILMCLQNTGIKQDSVTNSRLFDASIPCEKPRRGFFFWAGLGTGLSLMHTAAILVWCPYWVHCHCCSPNKFLNKQYC